MKKRLYFISTLLLAATALSLSSCLKDPRYVDFSKAGNVVDMPFSGLGSFGADAITETPADDANGTIVRQFAVNVATSKPTSSDTKVTLAVDNSIIDAYVATNAAVPYVAMPADAFSFTNTDVTIPAGKAYATVSVTIYKNKLDPSKSYMLPIKIAGAAGFTISGNNGVHYYHVIGNDFAGSYRRKYQRYNNFSDSTSAPLHASSFDFAAGNTATFSPVTPTEFTVYAQYVSGAEVRYDVTFTKNTDGTYSDFEVNFPADDVAGLGASGITVGQTPVFFDPVTHKPATNKLPGPYTFAEAQKIFHFQWIAVTSAPRYLIDTFAK